jgi:asparagine synthase (glutamine-hydrolysing)
MRVLFVYSRCENWSITQIVIVAQKKPTTIGFKTVTGDDQYELYLRFHAQHRRCDLHSQPARGVAVEPLLILLCTMCGIAGGFAFDPLAKRIEQSVVEGLNDLQRRRGPDGVGIWKDNNIVLGHRRLAIIETSASGAQPMTDATGRWVITFNGEIYNYRALRAELERHGHVFRSNSDTEVLINVISAWGEAGFNKVRGMYALALWDTLEKELWLARDPYGIKPLYVSESQGIIWFASQARALAHCAPVDTRRDAAGLVGFYLWGHVPEPFSWWAGIRMFPPGHVQRIRAGSMRSTPRAFASVPSGFTCLPPRPLDSRELREVLLDSVRHHLVADVPVGIFLSAGVDSNVIAALAVELEAKLKTITLAFDEYAGSPEDEAPIAEETARVLRTDHVTVRIRRREFEELLDDFLKSMDQPTIDGLNTYLASRAAAAQGLKVALSGLGGDELFGGYPSFMQIPRLLRIGRLFDSRPTLRRGLNGILKAIPLFGASPKAKGIMKYSKDVGSAYLLRRALYLEDELDMLLDESWLNSGFEQLRTHASLAATVKNMADGRMSEYAQVAALESCWYMRNQLLRDTDWSSMVHGLEVRVPFVDIKLLECVGPAVASAKPPSKFDLMMCNTRIPNDVVRRAKTGFTTPLRSWTNRRLGKGQRGLRGWADEVYRNFRSVQNNSTVHIEAA